MSAIKGLKNLNALLEKPKYEGTKVRWLKLADGQAATIRFMGELDADSPYYDESRGESVAFREHTNPKDYKRKAACTMDSEGRCYGCEMDRKEPKTGWRFRDRFYCNVIVDDGLEAPYVAVWSQGTSKQSAFPLLLEYFHDTNGITNLEWKIKRNGQGTETSYTLLPKGPDTEPFKWDGFEGFDLNSVLREIPYAEQEAFYFGFDAPSTTSATNADW
jgi:hypothetical protein